MSAKDRIKLLREKIECIVIDDKRNELINCLNVANDPKQSITLIRSMAEKITKQILTDIDIKSAKIFDACINQLEKQEVMSRGLVPREIISSLHTLRVWGNKAAHNGSHVILTLDTVDWIINTILQVYEWYYVEFECGPKIPSLYDDELTSKQAFKWQDYLSEINFLKANEHFKNHLDQDIEQAISALFLLPEYSAMGGEWCLFKLKKFLTQTYIKHDIKPSIIIDFSTPIKADKFELLYRIATHTKINCTNYPEWEECAQTVIKNICNSLRNSEVKFIELKNVHLLENSNEFLQWFIDEFWSFVKRELLIISKSYSYIKFICIITTDGQFQLNHPEIIELPLERWGFEEIKGWLQCYSNVPKPEIQDLTSTIYSASLEGIPKLVCEQFYKTLPNYE